MSIPFNIYLLAAVSACVTVLLALPLWRKWCLRTGLVDDPGHRKIHDRPIALAGGLAVMTGLLVPTLLAWLLLWWQAGAGSAGAPPAPSSAASHDVGRSGLLGPNSAFLLQYGLGKRAMELAGIFLGALASCWSACWTISMSCGPAQSLLANSSSPRWSPPAARA